MAAGTAIAAGVAGLGMLGSGAASAAAGRAAGRAAEAQLAESRRVEDFGKNLMTSVADLSRATPAELTAYERSLDSASNLVQRDSKLLEAIDPALLEASNQALSLIRGQDAAALAPLRKEREAQRSNLLRSLREQLGPGAESSTIGMRQLQKFDMDTASLLNNTQQSTLNMFLNSAQTQRAQVPGNTASLLSVGSGFGRIADRGLNAGTATMNAMNGVASNAGAPFVGEQVAAQGLGSMFNQVAQVGGTMLGRSLFGPDKTPTASSWDAFMKGA